ncbi:hypothetical protein [Paenibacillus agilis]|uniref:Uncharacterized protein n=1 Tax=Paenibacillus agilis TaxID=3020863 RepID=A0A559IE89_9BACL|nr:hypothetical protein [Paenibacillus agilis]TVX85972.1 hypothetical protein FPZ44_23760 [Paenibacillus agilis]
MSLHPLNFTSEELESKLKDKKKHVAELLSQYATSKDIKIKNEIEKIVHSAFDEIVKERINHFFDNLASINELSVKKSEPVEKKHGNSCSCWNCVMV